MVARAIGVIVALFASTESLMAQRPSSAPDSLHGKMIRGLAYGGPADSSQRLTLYQANVPPGSRGPTIVFIHGGGLTSGHRMDPPAGAMCENFVDAMISCATIDYRLVGQAKWSAQPEDVAAAIASVIRNIGSWHGDPDRVFLFGHSSGCHLAALVAADPRYLAVHGLSPSNLAGVVAMGCLLHQIPPAIADSVKLREFFSSGRWIYPSLETFRDADPTQHVGPHVPPALVLVAESEQLQPPILDSAQRFAQRMRNAGRSADVEVLSGRSHMTALTMMADPLDPTFARIVGFVSTTRR